MSRFQQDQFIDEEEEETCPLCVEEFDLSDKNFRPCPCGYQICQFCYNNIKTTMNGLCPACRRPYDEKNIEWKQISPEELASYKADLAQQAKKKAAARQKEAQKREAESLSRKHLAGLRVVQKNLVYVTGLSPTIHQDRLLETLRGDQYFGQYGKIIKIVVSKAKDTSHPQQSVGVYVTFASKDDAAKCIQAVDGSQNGERTLRAQYGTTKYCSAYLRGENCNNRNCMFLHEPGEENESFTRQDLSSMNVISTQQPAQAQTSGYRPPQPQPPPQHAPQPVAAATQAVGSRTEGTTSPTGSAGDGSALPSTASWANKGRRPSRTASMSTASPLTTNSVPQTQLPDFGAAEGEASSRKAGKTREGSEAASKPSSPAPQLQPSKPTPPPRNPKQKQLTPLDHVVKAINSADFKLVFSPAALKDGDIDIITRYPPLFDPNGGAKRRLFREREAEEGRRREEEARASLQAATSGEPEETAEGGSLQLGGEPEERHDAGFRAGQQHAIQPPSLGLGQNLLNEDMTNLSLRSGALNHQQHQQLLLQQLKNANPSSQSSLLNAFQNQAQPSPLQGTAPPGHARNQSRFSFANDTSSASTAVKPIANAKLLNQQSSMMPSQNNNQPSQHQPLGNQFYTSGVQGPPPGLKTVGTPPFSGGNMFGQGHGFATGGLGYGSATGRNANEEMMRELLRGQRSGNTGGSQLPSEAGKREFMFPYLNQHHPSSTSTPAPAPGLLSFPYGSQPGSVFQEATAAGIGGPQIQKQKKKGKKHRHANTSSSSGGGGIVTDHVADPSILQARLHQSAGNSAAGAHQGLYAGQGGQGGFSASNSAMYTGGFRAGW